MTHIQHTASIRGWTTAYLLDQLKHYYNGYSWDGINSLYNPHSVMNCLANNKFGRYWFATGTPTFLIDMMKSKQNFKPIIAPLQLGLDDFDNYQLDNVDEIPLLFQTGYLTVKKIDSAGCDEIFTVATPNEEVRDAMLKLLLIAYTHYPPSQIEPLIQRMQKQLLNLDPTGLENCLREMLAKIPYSTGKKTETWYHDLTMAWLTLLGCKLAPEVITNIGRIDAVWHCPQHTIVVEVKRSTNEKDLNKLLDIAIKQIRDNRYYEQFVGEQKQILLMGIAFAGNDVKCRIEKF
jgi:Holliday junction resolvase-like predicted endonuclease